MCVDQGPRVLPAGRGEGYGTLGVAWPEITHLAEPLDVPLPLRRRFLAAHLGEVYGAGRSLLLEIETAAENADNAELYRPHP